MGCNVPSDFCLCGSNRAVNALYADLAGKDAGVAVFVVDDQAAVVDPVSLPFLRGSEIAFVDELVGAQFAVRNPNAASNCGCGTSFSV